MDEAAPKSIDPLISSRTGKDTNHEAEAEKLIARIEAKDVRAIGELALAYIKMPLNDRTMWPYYRVAEGRVPVFFHTGIGPNRDHGKFNNPQFLGEIAAEFPNLVIVACHMAEGCKDELIQVMKKHERIYADLSVMNWYSYSCRSKLLKKLKSEGLLNRVLYGSDQMIYPGLISKSVKAVENSDLTR
ncbi:MAG: amidohydrolase family protein [Pirellulaceae bacterium]